MNPIALCRENGFAEAFILPVAPYEDWTRHRNGGAFHSNADELKDNPADAYPWANACMIAVWAYAPYDDTSVVAAYYPASNAAYHAMTRIVRMLNEAGIQAERAKTPFRTQLLTAGIGTKMDNQLWYYPPYGTYTHLEGVMLKLNEPVAFTPPHANEPVCDHCGRCDKVCYGALNGGRYDWHDCIRSYLETVPIPARFLPELTCFFGCQRCQDVCPKNPKSFVPVPDGVRAALDPVRILNGELPKALQVLGTNRKKQILRQAIVLCANHRRTDALPTLLRMREAGDSPYKSELDYAIFLLQKEKSMVK
ncbi:MAG: hypothetical protein IJP98_01470 [Clostridia bacterium]|nr:hypothetical protein [Clostridia bacterium]